MLLTFAIRFDRPKSARRDRRSGGVGNAVEWFDAELGADNVHAWAREQAGEVSHQMFDAWMHRNGRLLRTAAVASRAAAAQWSCT